MEETDTMNRKKSWIRSWTFLLAILIASTSFVYAQESPSSVKLKITGDIDPSSQTISLWVLRQNDSPHNPTTEIPIVDGKIDFVFETSEPDFFTLLSKQDIMERGTCMVMPFFAENGELSLTGKDTVEEPQCLKLQVVKSNSPLNKRLLEYNEFRRRTFFNELDSIAAIINTLSEDEFYSEEGKAFWNEFNVLMEKISENPDSLPLLEKRNEMFHKRDTMDKERKMNSTKYYELFDQMQVINNRMLDYEIETFGTPDGDLFSLAILSEDFNRIYDNDLIKERIIEKYLGNFKDRFSNTAMGHRMTEAVTGYEVTHIGGRYPDYQLPDADGTMYNIKDLINGKVVLIDLWGSTCGPCRVNSRSMIPVYNQFKDKGFDIIGIAREYRNLDGFHYAVEKDGYPWMQLIELDDATGIFNLHGIPNAMGGTFLVGPSEDDSSDIRILLLNPTAEELRAFLNDYYSKDR